MRQTPRRLGRAGKAEASAVKQFFVLLALLTAGCAVRPSDPDWQQKRLDATCSAESVGYAIGVIRNQADLGDYNSPAPVCAGATLHMSDPQWRREYEKGLRIARPDYMDSLPPLPSLE